MLKAAFGGPGVTPIARKEPLKMSPEVAGEAEELWARWRLSERRKECDNPTIA